MISFTLALIILLATFIFMYFTEMTTRKKYYEWYKEAEVNHLKCLRQKVESTEEMIKDVQEIKKSYLKELQTRKHLYLNFAEWVEALDTQTLTDELKEEIIRNADFDLD
jgi:hypothetical protein